MKETETKGQAIQFNSFKEMNCEQFPIKLWVELLQAKVSWQAPHKKYT